MKKYTDIALNTAKVLGADYCDIRIILTNNESIMTRNGGIGNLDKMESIGFGIRVIVDGAWGFASSSTLSKESIETTTKKAVEIGKASAMVIRKKVKLAREPVYTDKWTTPYLIDPFKVPVKDKLELLYAADEIMRKDKRIKVATGNMDFLREHQWFANTDGSFIEQVLLRSGAGISATAIGEDVQIRSYPTSFGGQYMTLGYEMVESLRLLDNAERVRDEAIALTTADECPPGKKDVILGTGQLGLQIHESVGHATELDRVLGMEANYAGTSFATTEKLHNFRYGSEIVNLVADSTVPTGLATIGYDDDGVRAQRWHIVKNGILNGYHTNRELSHVIDEERSKGCNRADGYNNIPIIRITNLSLMPGLWELDDLIKDTKDGIFMDTNRSWSIDQKRLNFQFGTEIAWEIKNGKKTRMLRNANYQGITPEFWNSCDAICNENYWQLIGVPNCGKGQPGQRAEMSHGCSPARFKNVTVGVGHKGKSASEV